MMQYVRDMARDSIRGQREDGLFTSWAVCCPNGHLIIHVFFLPEAAKVGGLSFSGKFPFAKVPIMAIVFTESPRRC